jgi:hypothetical protein
MTGVLFLIFGCAAVSLLSYLYCWQDIRGGAPHIISLRSVTYIMDRHQLNHLYGEPDRRWRYHFPPETLKRFKARWSGQFLLAIGADSSCLLGAYRYLTEQGAPVFLPWFVLLAGGYQALSYIWSYLLVHRWGHQIREEIEGFDD